jgi:hypothetical protein
VRKLSITFHDCWRAKTLSQAGRLVLIKSVSAFLLLASLCSQLDGCFKNFWWGFSSDKSRNLSLKAWDSIYLPKDLGGLGIKKMREANLSFISMLGWKLLSNVDLLWVA